MLWTGLSLLLLLCVAVSGASIVLYTLENGIPPSPTGAGVKRVMLRVIDDLKPSGVGCELGIGWGTLAVPISASHPNLTLVGYENSPVPYWISRWRASGRANLRVERANFLEVDLTEADLLICYQSPSTMSKLRPKFDAELKDDALVVSNTFAIPGWKPILTETVADLYRTKVYVYRKRDSMPHLLTSPNASS